ncbi:transcriptional regulatory protein RtcR [Paracidovorax citrulli]|nr:transcriptional regulatory protein RtcR [Paracidovorax citrulli]
MRWLWQPAGELRHAQTGGSAAGLGGRGEGPYADLDQELDRLLPAGMARTLDLFDRLQLEAVVRVCRECATLSEAGRRLFDQSRTQRSVVNDADRLRKYLLKFGLEWEAVRG